MGKYQPRERVLELLILETEALQPAFSDVGAVYKEDKKSNEKSV